MTTDKKGYVMYRSFIKSIRNLPAEDFKECVLAISDYALDGIEYTGKNGVVYMFMELVKPQIDANNSRYENGKKGGRPKKDPQPDEPLANVEAVILNDGSEWQPTESLYAEYVRLYPNVDVAQEFRNMRAWCLNNPKKTKTASGVKRFVNGWLAKEQNKGSYRQTATVKVGMPDYIANQLNGTLPERKEASKETLDAVRKMQEGMKAC